MTLTQDLQALCTATSSYARRSTVLRRLLANERITAPTETDGYRCPSPGPFSTMPPRVARGCALAQLNSLLRCVAFDFLHGQMPLNVFTTAFLVLHACLTRLEHDQCELPHRNNTAHTQWDAQCVPLTIHRAPSRWIERFVYPLLVVQTLLAQSACEYATEATHNIGRLCQKLYHQFLEEGGTAEEYVRLHQRLGGNGENTQMHLHTKYGVPATRVPRSYRQVVESGQREVYTSAGAVRHLLEMLTRNPSPLRFTHREALLQPRFVHTPVPGTCHDTAPIKLHVQDVSGTPVVLSAQEVAQSYMLQQFATCQGGDDTSPVYVPFGADTIRWTLRPAIAQGDVQQCTLGEMLRRLECASYLQSDTEGVLLRAMHQSIWCRPANEHPRFLSLPHYDRFAVGRPDDVVFDPQECPHRCPSEKSYARFLVDSFAAFPFS